MKNKIFMCFIWITAISTGISSLHAQVYPVRPKLSDPNSFSIIVLPDPQSYNKYDANQPLFELQTAWIACRLRVHFVPVIL